jgi:hypothetical protein
MAVPGMKPYHIPSANLCQEVDLDQLCEQLLTVVQETMQPTHISLWLRSQEQHTEKLSRTADPHDSKLRLTTNGMFSSTRGSRRR